jgi:transcriptional regulator with XRE-family HTH domain
METLTLNGRVAANLRGELARRQIKQEDFANKVGMSRPALTAILNDNVNITLARLEVLANALDMEPSKLLND